MNLITMVPATAKFFEQMRAMRRYIVENGVTEFAVFQNWCDKNNRRWAEALDSGCADAIEKFIAGLERSGGCRPLETRGAGGR